RIPIMVRVCRILALYLFKPWVFTGRLIEMGMNADVTVHGPPKAAFGSNVQPKSWMYVVDCMVPERAKFRELARGKDPNRGKKSGPHGPLWFALAVLYQFSNFVRDLCGENLVAIGFATHQRLGELGRLIQRDFGRHRGFEGIDHSFNQDGAGNVGGQS